MMLHDEDDFTASLEPCPPELIRGVTGAHTAIREARLASLYIETRPSQRGRAKRVPTAEVYLFTVGLQFYGISGWMSSDYMPVYGFAGDSFKTAADGFALAEDTTLLAIYSYGRAGHCYRAANEYRHATFAFFRAYELSKKLGRSDLTGYYCAEGWKIILDRWLSLPKVIGLSNEQLELEGFLRRISGYDFQWLVWYLLREEDFSISVAKQSHDGGIDLRGTAKRGGERHTVLIQCKNPQRANKNVGVAAIRELLGVYVIHRPNHLMFFTTTDFTLSATHAAHASGLSIDLVNGKQIFERLRKVYRFEISSPDIDDPDCEERSLMIAKAQESDLSADLLRASYHYQGRVSTPFYSDTQINEWLASCRAKGSLSERIKRLSGSR